MKGCKDEIQKYEANKHKSNLVYDYANAAFIVVHGCEHSSLRAVAELIPSEGVKGTVEDWLPGYMHELKEVEQRRLQKLTEVEARQVPKGTAVRLRMRLEAKNNEKNS